MGGASTEDVEHRNIKKRYVDGDGGRSRPGLSVSLLLFKDRQSSSILVESRFKVVLDRGVGHPRSPRRSVFESGPNGKGICGTGIGRTCIPPRDGVCLGDERSRGRRFAAARGWIASQRPAA